jgi:hypothetical protein
MKYTWSVAIHERNGAGTCWEAGRGQVIESTQDRDWGPGGPHGTSELRERLITVRKRKRAFAAKGLDGEAIRQRLREEQERRDER